MQFDFGCSYGTLNTIRSALSLILSNIDGFSVGAHPSVSRLLRGAGKVNPPKPKYDQTWDVNCVIEYIKTLWPLTELTLDSLTHRCVSLFSLATAWRCQSISLIRLENIIFSPGLDKVTIKLCDQTKTYTPGKAEPIVEIPLFQSHPKCCVLLTLKMYIEKTAAFRSANCEFLFISLRKPYKSVSSETISRWLKHVLDRSGIDISKFSSHSYRHAATSAAYRNGITVDDIRKHVGWSKGSETFARFYNRPVTHKSTFANVVLTGS